MELKEGSLAAIGATLILLLIGLLTGSILYYAAALLSVLFIAADYYRLARAMDGLQKDLSVKCGLTRNEIYLDASTRLICRLVYSGRAAPRVLVRQPLDDVLRAHGTWKPVKLSHGSAVYLTRTLHPSAGGTFVIPPPEVCAESWLFRDSYVAGKPQQLNVLLPLGTRIRRVGAPPPRLVKSIDIFEATVPKKGYGPDFSSIREYQAGDNVKRIDWIRSAKLNELVVRDYEDDQPLPALFLIDLAPSMGRGGDRSGLWSSIRLTTAIFNKIQTNWERIGIIGFSPSGVVRYMPPDTGSARYHEMRNLLSNLKAVDASKAGRHSHDALPYELKNVFRGSSGMLIDGALREYLANIKDDGFSRAVMTALNAVNMPSCLFVMTDASMGIISLANNLRVAQYYGHKVLVILMPRMWREQAMAESLETLQKLKSYGIEATVMAPDDSADDVILRREIAVLRGRIGG